MHVGSPISSGALRMGSHSGGSATRGGGGGMMLGPSVPSYRYARGIVFLGRGVCYSCFGLQSWHVCIAPKTIAANKQTRNTPRHTHHAPNKQQNSAPPSSLDKERRVHLRFRVSYMTQWGQSVALSGGGALLFCCCCMRRMHAVVVFWGGAVGRTAIFWWKQTVATNRPGN
jgi:hypothetical protein